MEEYLGTYGWHFSKKMCEWATKAMKPAGTYTKEQTEDLLRRSSIVLENNVAYDATYVINMARSDYWGSAIADEAHLAKFVKDYIDDKDGYDGIAFTRFYADCIGKGVPIIWEDMM